MHCPNCGSAEKSAVKETRRAFGGGIRRRRQCPDCYHDFETLEQVSMGNLRVLKSDGSIKPFDRARVRRGIVKAAVRPHHAEQLSELVESIVQEAQQRSVDNVVSSQTIGEIVLARLKDFDPVTHVRFALTQLGRRDHDGSPGWTTSAEFQTWLAEEYPHLTYFHPPAKTSWVVKRDGRREPFDRHKLERSIGVASKGRGKSDDEVRDLATRIGTTVVQELMQQAIITSGQVAAEIVRVLRTIDHVAAVRFASTAKGFVSVEDYETEALGLPQ